MEKAPSFGEVLETIEQLPLEDQAELIDIVRRRIIEQRRSDLVRDVQEAQKEFKAGKARPVTPDELMAEILS
jgi:hypothetical protein